VSDDFALVEQVIDESTRIVDVRGTIDAVRVASVLEAVAATGPAAVVLDLSHAAVERRDDLRALAGGLLRVRCGLRVVLVSPDPAVPVLIETLGLSDYIEVVPSLTVARATLMVDRAIDEHLLAPARPGPPAAGPPQRTPVRLDSVEGIGRVRLCDRNGALRLRGTGARWERRDFGGSAAVLTLTILEGATELAWFDAHLVRDVSRWIGDDGATGATVVVDA